MQRLIVAWISVCAACASGNRSPQPLVSVAPIKSELPRERQVDHALSRLTYGARPGDAQRVASMGLERWIALQLSPERIGDSATDSSMARYRTLGTPTPELVSTYREVRQARRQQQRDTMRRQDPAPRRQPDMSMDSRRELQLSMGEVAAS